MTDVKHVGAYTMALSTNFTRPNNATAYAAGDLVANNTAAASVAAMSWAAGLPEAGGQPYASFYVAGVRLHKSAATLTNAQFRVHLYSATPTFTSSGDNGVYGTVVATGNANWLGSFDGTMVALHADGASVICVPTDGVIIPMRPGATAYGLIEVLAAYAPAAQEVFTAELVLEQN